MERGSMVNTFEDIQSEGNATFRKFNQETNKRPRDLNGHLRISDF